MKLIILDRDGVINEDSDKYIKSVDEWQPVPGSIKAIADLSKSGFTIAVATNQSGIGRGFYSPGHSGRYASEDDCTGRGAGWSNSLY